MGFGKYSWQRTDKVFIKNILIPEFSITIPCIVDGISLKSAVFNIKSKSIIPNVSRNSVHKNDAERFSYAIGKAVHLWVLENVKLNPEEKSLLIKFLDTCYLDSNEYLK